jgi:hypothetical protein
MVSFPRNSTNCADPLQDLVATMMLMTVDWVMANREPDSSVGDQA